MAAKTDNLDLHGLKVVEAIEEFVRCYNVRQKGGQLGCWKIIHGYGSTGEGGAIRSRLRAFLSQHGDKLRYDPGDNYGDPGWTWVYPKLSLPDHKQQLESQIIEFCRNPKVEEKVIGEFRKHGDVAVKNLVRSLAARGVLQKTPKGSRMAYLSPPKG